MSTGKSSLREFLSVSSDFFRSVNGNLLRAFHGTRRNIEIIGVSQNTDVDVCCLEVGFQESNKFGDSDYLNAYSRYRQMRSDWWAFLNRNDFRQWDTSTSIISHFIPYLQKPSRVDTPYEAERTQHFGQVLIPYEQVKDVHSYYDEIHQQYGVQWLLQDGRGITIGPDVGLLFALHAAVKVLPRVETFVDLGAGTGELSAFLIKNELAKNIHINEYSPHLREHLRRYLEQLIGEKDLKLFYQFTDASEFQLPDKAEVVSMGIYYGAQPLFMERHGEKLRTALGDEGVLLVQSGMLENSFNISSITGDDPRLFDWSWYNERCCLKTYFAEVANVFLADEVITLASNSKETVAQMEKVLAQDFGAVTPPKLVEMSLS